MSNLRITITLVFLGIAIFFLVLNFINSIKIKSHLKKEILNHLYHNYDRKDNGDENEKKEKRKNKREA